MDRGTKNILIKDIQTLFRETHTDDMSTRSVLYGSSNHNQPIERWWRCGWQLALQFYINYFKQLEAEGNFESGNHTHVISFRYCFLHLVQQKLDQIRLEWNSHRVRTRGGVPNVMYTLPGLYGKL